MLELFIEMTNQVFWEGYAKQLSNENPELFRIRLRQFRDCYEHGKPVPTDPDAYFIRILQNNYAGSKSGMARLQG